jgi:predicted Rossmann-fold nucleotide-binding protein
MRQSILAFLIVGMSAAALSACASHGPPQDSYIARTEKLAAECDARGGILAPTGGQTGRPETDNVCKITGGASRLTTRN